MSIPTELGPEVVIRTQLTVRKLHRKENNKYLDLLLLHMDAETSLMVTQNKDKQFDSIIVKMFSIIVVSNYLLFAVG